MTIRNNLVFYGLIFLPLAAMITAAKFGFITSNIFGVYLAVYVFLYHPYISGLRLIYLDKLTRTDFWKMFIPFWGTRYFKVLFLDF
ncbi:hypothetical protein L0657_02415 [Dyadobacter sp. CY345]|uniref:hypothetical protein n=1 Tax=Dyadobacter sp. CY345 TaxID=2909335 RepID=UPI001F458E0D|nr:hypothetical protein [Dyadobacter sp. CY345]MCF2442795.1 hypothetical protein [Dyadobacter sp. CY345]